jgi:glycosyltransferase involved in cell wall biosynthesis
MYRMNLLNKCIVIGLKGLPAYGGAATVGENLIKALQSAYQFKVTGVSSHTKKECLLVEGISQVVFKNHGTGAVNTLIYYFKSLFYGLFHRFDFVHLHHAESGFITPFLRLKYKVIVTFHGVYNYKDPKFSDVQNWFFRLSERLNVFFANEVVSVSQPDIFYIEKKYGRKAHYIPNGITFSSESISILSKKNPQDYILFAAGRIYDIKGLHLLLEAMKLSGNTTLIKIAGDLTQVQSYKKKIESMLNGLNIEFLGLIKDKTTLMQLVADAKLFVFPSLTEAMSMMLLEVVSMKTPVIASDIPSNKAVFAEDEILFFKSNDSDDLKQKLEFAINNPEIMFRNAHNAYKKLSENYTWDVISKQYGILYHKLLN